MTADLPTRPAGQGWRFSKFIMERLGAAVHTIYRQSLSAVLKRLTHARPHFKIESFSIHDASRSEKLSLASTVHMSPWLEFKLTAASIVSNKKVTPRGASVHALTLLPPGGGIFAGRRVTALAVCRSAFVTPASAAPLRWLATRSFRPPLLDPFIHSALLGPASSARGKHYALCCPGSVTFSQISALPLPSRSVRMHVISLLS